MGGRGDLRAIVMQTGERIQRIRQTGPEFSPYWRLPQEAAPRTGADPWVMRLAIGAGVCFALMVVLFIVFYVTLNSGVDSLRTVAGPVSGGVQ
jgi:hypothetical protein